MPGDTKFENVPDHNGIGVAGSLRCRARIEFYSRAVLLVSASRGMPWRRGGHLQNHMPNSAAGSDRTDGETSSWTWSHSASSVPQA
jgi:hypothetical protein